MLLYLTKCTTGIHVGQETKFDFYQFLNSGDYLTGNRYIEMFLDYSDEFIQLLVFSFHCSYCN